MVAAAVKTKVRVVTDSTSCLPPGMARLLDVTVVPVRVHLGNRSGWEGVDLVPADVTHALSRREAVSTSPPTPQAFSSAFTAASGLGRESAPYDVVAILMSGALSETVEHARAGSQSLEAAGVRVEVVDARATAMALGFAVMAAARAAGQGHSCELVVRAALDALEGTEAMFYVDSLEQLRRGGRLGAGSAMLGTAMNLKPLLQFRDGRIEPLERVRGEDKALNRLVERICERAGPGPVAIAVHHLAAPERARHLVGELQQRLGERIQQQSITELGAVLGVHIGPGVAGVVLQRLV